MLENLSLRNRIIVRIVANSLHLIRCKIERKNYFLHANAAELSILLIHEKKSLVF